MTQPQNRGCPKWFLPMAIMAFQNRMGMHYRKNVWWYPYLHTIMIIYIYIYYYIILYYIILYYTILYYIILHYIILYYIIYIHSTRKKFSSLSDRWWPFPISVRLPKRASPASSQPHVFPQIQCAHGRLRRFLHLRQLGKQHAAVLNDT